ncbi:glycoside hydrolase family 9 protein [Thermopolyspora sp. NPDC052614]|uniref:glycoside hydrolase family 9 protein n=1 Tax=Thermopolyspora sp. NPDC052614 TaxID=3155682 RepID=UPI00341AE023
MAAVRTLTSLTLALAVVAVPPAVAATAPPITAAPAADAAVPDSAPTPADVQLRINQVAYPPNAAKHAYLMTRNPTGGTAFTVTDPHAGSTVLRGAAGRDLGRWNARYRHVYDLDLTGLRTPGRYRLRAGSVSADVTIGSTAAALSAVVTFFQGQRDGAEVIPGHLGRKPAHLNDRRADVYATPRFAGPDTDEIKGDLRRIDGPVDVEGGWFDAGDYLKFTHIAAYVSALLLAAERDGGDADSRLSAEARHGLKYLDKMWDEELKTLYIQVGIGSGNGEFAGDHDVWRLPEADDADRAHEHRFLRHRPVFRATSPRGRISPNLAGRVAAAFALAAQLEPDHDRARDLLNKAAEIYDLARTDHVKRLITSLPYAFYPETAWRDDLELGAAELTLAAHRLADPRRDAWLRDATHWAARYLQHEAGGDTFNLYDVSALAHADLIRALRTTRMTGLPVAETDLLRDLRSQLRIGTSRAAKDPFHAGANAAEFDAVPHAFGLAATASLYRTLTGDHSYDAFAQSQHDWAFGANAWGVSFIADTGTRSPRCPHHQIANITARPLTGAVVNGPNSRTQFTDGLDPHQQGMRRCPPKGDPYAPFTGRGARYADDTRAWQTSEPAIDFAAIALYALHLAT